MSEALKPLIDAAARGPLSPEQARAAFEILFDGEATPSQIGGLLMALRTRGETVDEYAAAASVMRDKCHAVRAPGSKVTWTPAVRPGASAWNSGSIRTLPVK